jgi:hypothetical protein
MSGLAARITSVTKVTRGMASGYEFKVAGAPGDLDRACDWIRRSVVGRYIFYDRDTKVWFVPVGAAADRLGEMFPSFQTARDLIEGVAH